MSGSQTDLATCATKAETERRLAETALRVARYCPDTDLAARLRLVAAELLEEAADREARLSMHAMTGG
jgi:hypothetical protein